MCYHILVNFSGDLQEYVSDREPIFRDHRCNFSGRDLMHGIAGLSENQISKEETWWNYPQECVAVTSMTEKELSYYTK